MWANNETGVLFPVREIAAICRRKGVLFHTDAVQTPGKLKIDVRELDVDFLSLSAHKLHAPKGIGLLYVKRRVKYQPYVVGGGQERGRRGGTENVANIVAFGRAAELAMAACRTKTPASAPAGQVGGRHPGALSARLAQRRQEPRLPNTSNIAFEGVEAEGILMLLDQAGICASSGSACTTGSLDPSHVLTAMGIPYTAAHGTTRFSLSRYTTEEEIDRVIQVVPEIVAQLRKLSPYWGENGPSAQPEKDFAPVYA